ncbi:hypothetical protein KAI04_01725 [Candidatus Pacearchaeota archaeon]|nr:hypothetical protein [Candidatus Pacearchaeota archaeon]
MLNKIQKNNKAQISEIMTWIIATIAILIILIIFISASSFLAQKTKTVQAQNLEIDFEKEISLLDTKTLIAYSFASESQRNIIEKWEQENE